MASTIFREGLYNLLLVLQIIKPFATILKAKQYYCKSKKCQSVAQSHPNLGGLA
jgi:hypothetical protein